MSDKPCKIWQGCINSRGYGEWPNSQYPSHRAHRVVFFLAHGWWPPVVRHACDVKSCVEITHLLPGTHQDNKNDAVERGLHARGESHGMAKLTDEQVAALRDAPGAASSAQLARDFGLSRAQVYRIRTGKQRTCLPA